MFPKAYSETTVKYRKSVEKRFTETLLEYGPRYFNKDKPVIHVRKGGQVHKKYVDRVTLDGIFTESRDKPLNIEDLLSSSIVKLTKLLCKKN